MTQAYPRTTINPGLGGGILAVANALSNVSPQRYDLSQIAVVAPANQRRRRLHIRLLPASEASPTLPQGYNNVIGFVLGTDINAMRGYLGNGGSPLAGGFPGWAMFYEPRWLYDATDVKDDFWLVPPPPVDITVPDPVYCAYLNLGGIGGSGSISWMEESNV